MSHAGNWRKREQQVQAPEVEVCLACSRKSKEASDTRQKGPVDTIQVD